MNYEKYLAIIIDDGIKAAKRDYASHSFKLEGAIEGFEACRGKSPEQLLDLLKDASNNTRTAKLNKAENYWRIRCYESEVEWVCNCVAALQFILKQKQIMEPTMRGYLKMKEVLGNVLWQTTSDQFESVRQTFADALNGIDSLESALDGKPKR